MSHIFDITDETSSQNHVQGGAEEPETTSSLISTKRMPNYPDIVQE